MAPFLGNFGETPPSPPSLPNVLQKKNSFRKKKTGVFFAPPPAFLGPFWEKKINKILIRGFFSLGFLKIFT